MKSHTSSSHEGLFNKKKNLLHNKSGIQTVQQQEEKSVQNTGKEATINCLSSWGSLDNSDSLKTVWSANTSLADQRRLTSHMTCGALAVRRSDVLSVHRLILLILELLHSRLSSGNQEDSDNGRKASVRVSRLALAHLQICDLQDMVPSFPTQKIPLHKVMS